MTPDDAGAPDLLARDLDRYFGQLVLTYEARLFAFMARQTGSTQEAEDIVQEAFMQAYFALGRYSQQQRAAVALRPWLYKIALNIFYGRLRKPGLPVVALDFSEEGPHLEVEEDQGQQIASHPLNTHALQYNKHTIRSITNEYVGTPAR